MVQFLARCALLPVLVLGLELGTVPATGPVLGTELVLGSDVDFVAVLRQAVPSQVAVDAQECQGMLIEPSPEIGQPYSWR